MMIDANDSANSPSELNTGIGHHQVGGIGPPISMPNQSAVYVKLNDIE
jgi:hypothetical protein